MEHFDFLNTVPNFRITPDSNFILIAGPCVVETRDVLFETASHLKSIADRLNIPFIFKSSYRKANRTKSGSFTGIGDVKALELLGELKESLGVPILTDVHESSEVDLASRYADILQIPAFLCRQTELIQSAARTGKPINLKKGQFLSPQNMQFGIEKIEETGNKKVILTERGTTFGYGDLVVDFRGIPIMKEFGYPVILDITHSLQQPNQSGGVSGRLPHLIETLAKAGVASGIDGIFMETHPDPSKALSDGSNMLALDKAGELLESLVKLYQTVKTL